MSVNKKISPSWILFKSGSSSLVTVNLYSALPGSTRPVDAYIVTECEGAFSKAARRAADSVYQIFEQKFGVKPLVAGFDLQDINEKTLTGSSGGLSFAIALAKKMFSGDDPGPVAATGEILSNGQLSPVSGISEKIKAAVPLLPEGGWIFLPAANKNDISAQLLSEIKSRKINFVAVSSVAEALDSLFQWTDIPQKTTQQRPQTKWKKIASMLLLVLVIAVGASFIRNNELLSSAPNSEMTEVAHPNIQSVAPDKIDKINKPVLGQEGQKNYYHLALRWLLQIDLKVRLGLIVCRPVLQFQLNFQVRRNSSKSLQISWCLCCVSFFMQMGFLLQEWQFED
jgi:hypothetical protein